MVGTYWACESDARIFRVDAWYASYGFAACLTNRVSDCYVYVDRFSTTIISGHPCEPISEDELPFYLLSVE
jgi:hypothetical protein